MLLGGSAQQVSAIRAANRLGMRTVLIDYLPDNPGKQYADRWYGASTTDIDAVRQIARKENIDGILAYASEPAACTAAVIAKEMHLPGNDPSAAAICSHKGLFRAFQKEQDLHPPLFQVLKNETLPESIIFDEKKTYIVKPEDSSGSKGVTVAAPGGEEVRKRLSEAVRTARDFSRSKTVIIEEYIEHHNRIIGGDIYVHDGEIILWGLMDCVRDLRGNHLVPVGKKYPADLSAEEERIIKETVRKTVSGLGIRFGGMNLEIVLRKEKQEAVILDIGARSGGNRIPELLDDTLGSNIPEWSVLDAAGIPFIPEWKTVSVGKGDPGERTGKEKCAGLYVLHSLRSGTLKKIVLKEELQPYIIKDYRYSHPGDKIEMFANAGCSLGVILMRFSDRETMNGIMGRMNEYVTVEVE